MSHPLPMAAWASRRPACRLQRIASYVVRHLRHHFCIEQMHKNTCRLRCLGPAPTSYTICLSRHAYICLYLDLRIANAPSCLPLVRCFCHLRSLTYRPKLHLSLFLEPPGWLTAKRIDTLPRAARPCWLPTMPPPARAPAHHAAYMPPICKHAAARASPRPYHPSHGAGQSIVNPSRSVHASWHPRVCHLSVRAHNQRSACVG